MFLYKLSNNIMVLLFLLSVFLDIWFLLNNLIIIVNGSVLAFKVRVFTTERFGFILEVAALTLFELGTKMIFKKLIKYII